MQTFRLISVRLIAQPDFTDMHCMNRNVSLDRKFRISFIYNFKRSPSKIVLDSLYVL